MKRLVWLGVGYVAGISTALSVRRRLQRAAQRYAPEQVRRTVTDRSRIVSDRARQAAVDGARRVRNEAQRVVDDIQDAANVGRGAMRRTEDELQQ